MHFKKTIRSKNPMKYNTCMLGSVLFGVSQRQAINVVTLIAINQPDCARSTKTSSARIYMYKLSDEKRVCLWAWMKKRYPSAQCQQTAASSGSWRCSDRKSSVCIELVECFSMWRLSDERDEHVAFSHLSSQELDWGKQKDKMKYRNSPKANYFLSYFPKCVSYPGFL